jgi:hypothetical protein
MSAPPYADPPDAAAVEAALHRISTAVQRALARVMAGEQEERAARESGGEEVGAAAPTTTTAATTTRRKGSGYATPASS